MPFGRSYAIYGTFGLISGSLTPLLVQGRSPEPNILLLPWLPGVAFGLALASATACILGFQPRQLLIIPYVLAGWFCAMLIYGYAGSIGTVFGTGAFAFYIVEAVVVFVAGGIGALITALGIPVATGRALARHSYLCVMLTGALVAEAWGVAMAILRDCDRCYVELWSNYYVPRESLFEIALFWHNYILFPLWQALVAVAIGRSITLGDRT